MALMSTCVPLWQRATDRNHGTAIVSVEIVSHHVDALMTAMMMYVTNVIIAGAGTSRSMRDMASYARTGGLVRQYIVVRSPQIVNAAGRRGSSISGSGAPEPACAVPRARCRRRARPRPMSSRSSLVCPATTRARRHRAVACPAAPRPPRHRRSRSLTLGRRSAIPRRRTATLLSTLLLALGWLGVRTVGSRTDDTLLCCTTPLQPRAAKDASATNAVSVGHTASPRCPRGGACGHGIFRCPLPEESRPNSSDQEVVICTCAPCFRLPYVTSMCR
mmetsp:Transcript_3145/g.9102  ORF Transcript_3145/g.9102 Transcript_3145/m.9102 type:complete len:275 (-) Transcript_3145:1431-2255(-)